VCPVTNGCTGGDHDYLRVDVKAGVPYLIATFDLGPGVDTVLDVFWGNESQPLISADDAVPGRSFLSVIRWVAPGDGQALIRVGPRTGGLNPIVFDEGASSYRFAIVLAQSPLAQDLEQRIAQQSNAPQPKERPAAPVAAPVVAAPPAAAPVAPAPTAP